MRQGWAQTLLDSILTPDGVLAHNNFDTALRAPEDRRAWHGDLQTVTCSAKPTAERLHHDGVSVGVKEASTTQVAEDTFDMRHPACRPLLAKAFPLSAGK